MVHTAEADVVCPAVAAEDPNGLLGKVFLVVQNILARVAVAVERFKRRNQVFCCRRVLIAVVDGVKVRAASRFHSFRSLVGFRNGFDFVDQTVADRVLAEIHAVAVLGVVLKQRVCPSGAMAVLVDGVRRGRRGPAPNGRAARRVGDIHSVAEQLRDESRVGGLRAARARAGELQKRGLVLAADDGVVRKIFLDADVFDHVVERRLLLILRFARDHLQGVGRAHADADAAAHAVHGGDGHRVFVNVLALAFFVCKRGNGGRRSRFLGVKRIGADRRVRADICALVALYAGVGVPLGNHDRNAALLVSGSALFERAVRMIHEGGNGKAVAVHLADGLHDGIDHLDELRGTLVRRGLCIIRRIRPLGGHVDLHIGGSACIDRLFVHFDDLFALLHELLCLFLHVADGFRLGQHLGKGEERRLQNRVGALAKADLGGDVDRVHGIKLDVVLRDVTLCLCVKLFGKLCGIPLAVDEEHAAGLDVLHHFEALFNIGGVVASHKVRLVDVVGALDRLVAEAQVGNGHTAGLFGVILEICLYIFVGMVADDLDGVLVRTNRAVAAKTPELALDGAFRRSVGRGLLGQGKVGHVIVDADGEAALGMLFLKVLIHGKDGCGRGVLGTKTVTAAADLNVSAGFVQRGDDIQEQRFTDGAGFLSAVKYSDLFDGSGDRIRKMLDAERTIQTDFHKTDLFALRGQIVDDFFRNVADGAHRNDHAVSIRRAVVVKQLVVRAELFVDLVHVLFNDSGDGVIIFVARLSVLEEDVAVFVRTAHHGALGVERALAERMHSVHVAHFLEVFVVPNLDLLDLVRGAETVKEVDERHSAFNGGKVRDRAEVHDLLRVRLGEHREARLAAGIHVGVVTEDVQRM